MPVQIQSWQDAMTVLCKGSARAIDTKGSFIPYDIDDWIKLHNKENYARNINTVNLSVPVPEVIVLSYYDKMPRRQISFSRENLWIRDDQKCGYCLEELLLNDLTIDHVVPRKLGGQTSFMNCVSACSKCNHEKDHLPPVGRWNPKIKPREPNTNSIIYHLHKKLNTRHCEYPEIWDKFLMK